MKKNFPNSYLLAALLVLSSNLMAMTESADELYQRGVIDDDYYAAGGIIDIDANVEGDLIVAGGELRLGHQISGDLIAAGGRLEVRGKIGDDVRISGGKLDIDALIGDDLAAAGGKIELSAETKIDGDAWLTGGEVVMAAMVAGDLSISAGKILLSGVVQGDVTLDGGEIEILEGARILGDLVYRSPQAAIGVDRLNIDGQVDHQAEQWNYGEGGFGLFFSVSLVIASILFYLLFPYYTRAAVSRMQSDPWSSLGLGFLCFILTPFLASILMLLVLGLWIGLSLLALYGLALLAGFLLACFFVAERGASLFKQELSSRSRRLIAVVIAIFVLGLLQNIPLLGGLLLFLLMLLGLGAGVMQLRHVYRLPSDTA